MLPSVQEALANDSCDFIEAVEKVGSVELTVSDLSKRFEAGRHVLSDISFEIRAREAVSLIGANGAGKSTLLRCCVGLTTIDCGSVRLLGKDLASLGGRELRRLR